MTLDIETRLKEAAVDATLRQAASEIWKVQAPRLFEPHDERHGLRISDAGKCVRLLYNLVNGLVEETFTPEVQLDNLDNGTMVGCWTACLLAASLEADGYQCELEPEVSHDGTPGHIDLFFKRHVHRNCSGELTTNEQGVVEIKLTMWPRALTNPEQRARYQVLQAAKYAAAKKVEDFAIITRGPASSDKMRVDWYRLGDWVHALLGEDMRLQAALGPVEPEGDPDAPWRCRGCPVIHCPKNPGYEDGDVYDESPVAAQLAASLEAK